VPGARLSGRDERALGGAPVRWVRRTVHEAGDVAAAVVGERRLLRRDVRRRADGLHAVTGVTNAIKVVELLSGATRVWGGRSKRASIDDPALRRASGRAASRTSTWP
jgi:hypothetical protein